MGEYRWRLRNRTANRRALMLSLIATLGLGAACIPAPVVTDPQVRVAISRCWNSTGRVWLTFDDSGPTANVNALIDVLVRNNVRARFFPLGAWAQANPWLIARMALSGQELGNHSYDHVDFNTISDAQVGWEIDHGTDHPRMGSS